MVPAQPPLPTISKRLFQFVGSFTANRASGQMTPRMSQCSGKAAVAGMSFADSIFTSAPKGMAARSPHFFTGAAKTQVEANRRQIAAFLMTRILYEIE